MRKPCPGSGSGSASCRAARLGSARLGSAQARAQLPVGRLGERAKRPLSLLPPPALSAPAAGCRHTPDHGSFDPSPCPAGPAGDSLAAAQKENPTPLFGRRGEAQGEITAEGTPQMWVCLIRPPPKV